MLDVLKDIVSYILYLLSLPAVIFGLKKAAEWWVGKSVRKLEIQRIEIERQKAETDKRRADDARREIDSKIAESAAEVSGKLLAQLNDMSDTIQEMREDAEKKDRANSEAMAKVTGELTQTVKLLAETQQQFAVAQEDIITLTRQVSQATIDQAEVQWARKVTVEYEAMRDQLTRQDAELVQLREEVKEVPYLRAEVARLTALLEETTRERDQGLMQMRQDLGMEDITNG